MTTRPAPTRRRGRPRTVDTASGLEPREEILQHAARIFSARGVGATRMADIAESVGVRPPAIYYHFDNMDAIVADLLDYVVDQSAAFATAAASGHGTCSDRLHALVAHHIDRLTAGPYDLWFVAGMSDAEAERFPDVAADARRWLRAVDHLVTEGADAGEFRAIDSQVARAAVSGLIYGALELRHRAGHVDADEIADLVVAALAP